MRVRSSTINVNWGSNDVFYFPSPREIWESIYGQLFRCSTLNWKLSLLLLLLGSALSPSSFPFMKMTINVWKSTLVILLMWRQNLEHWMLNTNGLEWINQFNFQLKWKFKMLLAHLITIRVILQNWVIPFTYWAFKLILWVTPFIFWAFKLILWVIPISFWAFKLILWVIPFTCCTFILVLLSHSIYMLSI